MAEGLGVGAILNPHWGHGAAPGQLAGSGLGDARRSLLEALLSPCTKLGLKLFLSLPPSLRMKRDWLWGEAVSHRSPWRTGGAELWHPPSIWSWLRGLCAAGC